MDGEKYWGEFFPAAPHIHSVKKKGVEILQDKRGDLLSPVLVDMAGRKGRVKAQGRTLQYLEMAEGGETSGPRYRLDRDIKAFEGLVTEPGRLYLALVDEEETLHGVGLGKDSFSKLFEPYRASGAVHSLSLALGLNNDVNLFFAVSGYKGARLFHCRAEEGTLKQVSVLEEGGQEDFRALKSSSDHWGSFNLFYLALEKGASVLRHRFFVPFSRTWSSPVTLYGPDQGEVKDYSFYIDTDNNIYVALLLEGNRKREIVHMKRDMGGWPRGGWQRPILISQEERGGVPVIDFYRKGYLQVFFFAGEGSKLFLWRDGEVKSLQKKALDAGGKILARYRSTSGSRPQYSLWSEDEEVPPGLPGPEPGDEEEEEEDCLPGDGEGEPETGRTVRGDGKGEAGEDDGEGGTEGGTKEGRAGGSRKSPPKGEPEDGPRDERDRFVKQAIQIMQAKTDLEAGLRRKEKELARQQGQYENRLKLLRDQLASRNEAFKSLEAKLSRQEAAALGFRAEQKSWEKEINQLKKENWELKEAVKRQEKDNRELSIKADGLQKQVDELEKQAARQGFMDRVGQFFKK